MGFRQFKSTGTGFALVTLMLLSLTACLTGIPKVRTESWDRVDLNQWQFETQDLLLSFAVVDRQFLWRFKNNTLLPLQLDHEFLFLEHNGQLFHLWGSPRDQPTDMPPIYIKPGGFVELSYPIRYSSPLFPFPKAGEVSLHLTTQWPRRNTAYILVFPNREGQ